MNEEKSILSTRIYQMRKEVELTQEELALKLGLKGKSSIANYESGKITPSDDIKLKMCEIFDCSMDYLMGKSDYKTKEDAINKYIENQCIIDVNNALIYTSSSFLEADIKISERTKLKNILVSLLLSRKNSTDITEEMNSYINSFPKRKQKKIQQYISEVVNYIRDITIDRDLYHNILKAQETINQIETPLKQYYMCPVYGQISAGQPNWAEENIEGRIPIDTNLMDIVNPEEHFFLRVNGESMNKIVKNGSFALIHKQDTVENGEIAVVLVNGFDATLKKFTKKGDIVVLEPDSDVTEDPDIKTQIYDKTTPIKILGKYVGKMEINK